MNLNSRDELNRKVEFEKFENLWQIIFRFNNPKG